MSIWINGNILMKHQITRMQKEFVKTQNIMICIL